MLQCNIFSIILTAMNSVCVHHIKQQRKKVTQPASCFFQDLGLALAAKTCPHRPHDFKRSILVKRFRRKKSFFLNERRPGTPRHPAYVSRKCSKNRSRKVTSSRIIRQKLIQHWNQVTTRQVRKLYMFSAQKPKCSRRFTHRSWNSAHVLCEPLSTVQRSFFFFAENLGLFKVQVSKIINDQTSGWKEKKKHSIAGWQGLTEHVCNFQDLLLINVVIHLERARI